MANRRLYALELNNDAVIVYRTDNNYGRQGVVFKNGTVRLEYTPYAIPQYIKEQALAILGADSFELKRGYTYGGTLCQINKKPHRTAVNPEADFYVNNDLRG